MWGKTQVNYEAMVNGLEMEPDEKIIDWSQAMVFHMANKGLGKTLKRSMTGARLNKVAPIVLTNKRFIIVGVSVGTGQLTDQKGVLNWMHNQGVKAEKNMWGTVSGNIHLNSIRKVKLKTEGSIYSVIYYFIIGIRYLNIEWDDKQFGPCVARMEVGSRKKPRASFIYAIPLIGVALSFRHPSRKWMKALRMQAACSSHYPAQEQQQSQESPQGYQSHHPYQNQHAYPSQQQQPQQVYQSHHPYQNQQPYPTQQQQPPQQGYQSHHSYQNQQPHPSQQQQPPQQGYQSHHPYQNQQPYPSQQQQPPPQQGSQSHHPYQNQQPYPSQQQQQPPQDPKQRRPTQ